MASNVIELTQQLLGFESVTPAAAPIFDWLGGYLQGKGWQVERVKIDQHHHVPVENLFAWRGNPGGQHLCFAGHVDVVPAGDRAAWQHPPFAGTIDNNVLFGRGVVDMKGCVGAFIAAANNVFDLQPDRPGTISFLITGDEEGTALNGTAPMLEWLKARNQLPDFCLVAEPSCSKKLGDNIRIGRRGSCNFNVTVHGHQGHAAYPQRVLNPHEVLAYWLEYLRQHPLDQVYDHFPITSWQITKIETLGETARNLVPASCYAEGNVRFNPSYNETKLQSWFQMAAAAAKTLYPNAAINITTNQNAPAFITEPGPLTERLSQAIQEITGLVPQMDCGGGTSDARFIQAYCPVFEFGLLNGTAHQVDENAPVADLLQLTSIYQRFIELSA